MASEIPHPSPQSVVDAWIGPQMVAKVYSAQNIQNTKIVAMLRAGVPNDLRGRVYQKLLRVEKMPGMPVIILSFWFQSFNQDYEKNFELALKRSFGALVPKSPLPPTFGGRTHQNELSLSSEISLLVDYILCIVAHDFPSLEYCPFVPPLTAIICHFCESKDDGDGFEILYIEIIFFETALGGVISIVKQAHSATTVETPTSPDSGARKVTHKTWKYFPTFRKDVNFLSRGFSNLLHATNQKLHLHIHNLQSSMPEPLWSRWMTDFFIGVLPLTTVWRIFDSFLVEGYTTLFRAGIALLLARKELIFKASSSQELSRLFGADSSKTPDLASDAFISSLWTLRNIPTNVDIRADIAQHHETLKAISRADDLHEQQYRNQRAQPKLTRTTSAAGNGGGDGADGAISSTILGDDEWVVLWSWMPASMRARELALVFSTREHGHHVSTLFNRTAGRRPLLMIVESACGSVFGACLSEPWPECDAGRGVFYGTGETFLFTLSPYAKMYPWVGRVDRDGDGVGEGESDSPSMFIMATRHEITLGGGGSGFGLWLNEDLSIGTTDYCQTFANSPLTGNGEKKFECLSVEVYAFE